MYPVMFFVMFVTRAMAGALTSLWALIALGASVAVLEDAVPVLAGFAAHQENLPVLGATIACALGGWATALVPYVLARWGATRVVSHWPGAAATIERLTGVVARRPWRAALAARFILGARTLLPLACGAARVPAPVYVIGTAISSLVWAMALVALGWASGETVLLVLGRARRHEWDIAAALVVIVLLVVLLLQRRNRPHVVEELESADEIFPPKDA
jgi:membrane protein DedA with SNARE-associated domain